MGDHGVNSFSSKSCCDVVYWYHKDHFVGERARRHAATPKTDTLQGRNGDRSCMVLILVDVSAGQSCNEERVNVKLLHSEAKG